MLSGTRVCDLSRLLPGPFATQILADLGAEVIKIEDPDAGDYFRLTPPLALDGQSFAYHAINRGKKSVILDLKLEEDITQLFKLLKTCDVLVETFRPGVMAKLGLDPEKLLIQFPKLIICSISGYGQDGPGHLRAGHDANYLSVSGVLGIMKTPGLLPVQVADIAGGSYPAVIQILAALYSRVSTRKGTYIDVSMTDCALALTSMSFARFEGTGESYASGTDILCGKFPCYDIYATLDGHVSVGALEPKFWRPMVKAIGIPQIETMQFDSTGATRTLLAEKLFQHPNSYWREFFGKHDFACEVIESPNDAVESNPQLKSRDLTLDITIDGGQSLRVLKTPLRMPGVKFQTTPGPQHGTNTADILSNL